MPCVNKFTLHPLIRSPRYDIDGFNKFIAIVFCVVIEAHRDSNDTGGGREGKERKEGGSAKRSYIFRRSSYERILRGRRPRFARSHNSAAHDTSFMWFEWRQADGFRLLMKLNEAKVRESDKRM